MDKYVVMFNTASAIEKMPTVRREWERQLIDDFIRAINNKRYQCNNYEELLERLKFIDGSSSFGKNVKTDPDSFVFFESDRYGERVLPVAMYGMAQGYVDFEQRLEPLKHGRTSVSIPFKDFYDMRQNTRAFSGCYVTIIPGELEVAA